MPIGPKWSIIVTPCIPPELEPESALFSSLAPWQIYTYKEKQGIADTISLRNPRVFSLFKRSSTSPPPSFLILLYSGKMFSCSWPLSFSFFFRQSATWIVREVFDVVVNQPKMFMGLREQNERDGLRCNPEFGIRGSKLKDCFFCCCCYLLYPVSNQCFFFSERREMLDDVFQPLGMDVVQWVRAGKKNRFCALDDTVQMESMCSKKPKWPFPRDKQRHSFFSGSHKNISTSVP